MVPEMLSYCRSSKHRIQISTTKAIYFSHFCKVHIWTNRDFEILQLRAKFQTAMMSCSRFIRITNSSDHRMVWTAKSTFAPVEILRHFNFEPSFKLRWRHTRDLFGSQISVTTRGFEQQISCIRGCYLKAWWVRRIRSTWIRYLMTLVADLCWDSSIFSQGSNCDGVVLKIYLDYKFQWPQEGLYNESLAYEVVT